VCIFIIYNINKKGYIRVQVIIHILLQDCIISSIKCIVYCIYNYKFFFKCIKVLMFYIRIRITHNTVLKLLCDRFVLM